MKVCFKCNIEKALDEFYKHKMMADGHLNKCKDCARKDSMNILDANRDKINRLRRIRRAKESGKYAEYSSHYRNEKYMQSQAVQRVYRAIKTGQLKRSPQCLACGKLCKTEAHHGSYKKSDWLKVIFLCRSCHRKTHVDIQIHNMELGQQDETPTRIT